MLAAITGASSGIGRALAKQFASNGFDLLVVAETPEVEEAAAELRSLGVNVRAFQCDLATADGVERFADAIASNGTKLDAVAINAGVGVGGAFDETDLEAELRLIDLNCRSTVHLAKRVVRMMREFDEGRILFTASIASLMPSPFEAVYGASKAFVYSFAESLHNELKDTGISVTALLPGPTETNFFHRAGMDDTKAGADKKDDPDDVARQAYDALMAGKDRVVAGSLKTKAQAAIVGALPPQVSANVHRGMSEPGSAGK